MTTVVDILNFENPIFNAFVFWSTVLVLKMLLMSILTAMQRFKTKTFANAEDTTTFKNLKPKFNDPDVERVRRAHRNDMENIPAFITVAFFYMLTSPSAFFAINLFRIAAIGRIVHTIVYAIFPMQPTRAIAWFACYATTAYMGIQVLFFFLG
ncbi:CLUMA_CG017501, isoform A [Clunio marinus]|uniref:Microsomal glutathione S-transferase 1 n=1 Tax=Clunio marinus TaxID=568069 RepID=A0A1J1IW67_9DIPT|nr:CLUMA_CG017501, isoform A [Clunio marinus]